MKRLLPVAASLLILSACAPPQGWHYEQIWTNLPDLSAHRPSWQGGRYLSCQVQDHTYVVRRCF